MAQAATLMGLSKRQTMKRLARMNERVGGRLLKSIGEKRMPSGVQSSKFLVSTEVFLQSMRPAQSDTERDIDRLRVDLVLTMQKVDALRDRLRALDRE